MQKDTGASLRYFFSRDPLSPHIANSFASSGFCRYNVIVEHLCNCLITVRRHCAMEKLLKIKVDCANCALKMEAAARKTPGVKEAEVSFMALKMRLVIKDDADAAAVIEAARQNCKKAVPDSDIIL